VRGLGFGAGSLRFQLRLLREHLHPQAKPHVKMRFEFGLNSNQRIQARIAEGSKYLRPELAKAARPTTVKWLLMEIG
jgi:hypothetical protein